MQTSALAPTSLRVRVATCAAAALPLVAACGAATSTGAHPPPASSAPAAASSAPRFDLAALVAREPTVKLSATRLSALGGKVTANVLAAGPLIVKPAKSAHEVDTVSVPIGASMPVECFIRPGMSDAAAWTKAALPELPGAQADLPTVVVSVEGGRATLVSSHLRLHEKTAYESKVATAVQLEWSVLCHHGEIGYHAAFEAVARSLVATLELAGDTPPVFTSIDEVTSAGRKVGVETTTVIARADGKRSLLSIFAAIVPAGTSWVTMDGVEVEVVEPSGLQVLASHAFGIDGNVVQRYELSRVGKLDYAVKGEARGKPIDAIISAPEPFASSFVSAERKRAVAAGKPGPSDWYRVNIDTAPPSAERVTAKLRSGRRLVLTHGREEAECEVDDQGLCSVVESETAIGKLVFRRVFVRGRFSAKD